MLNRRLDQYDLSRGRGCKKHEGGACDGSGQTYESCKPSAFCLAHVHCPLAGEAKKTVVERLVPRHDYRIAEFPEELRRHVGHTPALFCSCGHHRNFPGGQSSFAKPFLSSPLRGAQTMHSPILRKSLFKCFHSAFIGLIFNHRSSQQRDPARPAETSFYQQPCCRKTLLDNGLGFTSSQAIFSLAGSARI